MVGTQSLGQSGLVVVTSLNKRLTSDIIGHVLLWWVEDLVVAATGGRMDESASDTSNEQSVINLKFDGVLERRGLGCKHLVELFSLSDSAWEAIKDETECNS